MDKGQARELKRSKADIMGRKRQDKALREFKQVLEDLLFLLRSASDMETVYLYWVNRSRKQFVMETKATVLDNVMFQDRVSFDRHFLGEFREIQEPVAIELDVDIPADSLKHYYDRVPVRYITLLPFVNNGETVAITVLESKDHIFTEDKSEVINSYIEALGNVLNTYLEISDLYEQQEEWNNYEDQLSSLNIRCHRTEMIRKMLNLMQFYLHRGGVSFVTQGMNTWCNAINADGHGPALPVGMQMEQRTLAEEALQKGEPEFAIHFNNNPKRLSPRERNSEGATLAIPMIMKDRRQGVVLVYDENPLIFKESTKHKLINLVRTAGLQILANDPNLEVDQPILTNEYDAFLRDLWERVVDTELSNIKNKNQVCDTWFGLITVSNLPELRTKLRLEELKIMQKDLIATFNPNLFGYPGILGYHSDYVYSFLIQSNDSKAVEQWTKALKQKFSRPFELSNGSQIETGVKAGFTRLEDDYADSYQVLSNAKSALSQAMNSNREETG